MGHTSDGQNPLVPGDYFNDTDMLLACNSCNIQPNTEPSAGFQFPCSQSTLCSNAACQHC